MTKRTAIKDRFNFFVPFTFTKGGEVEFDGSTLPENLEIEGVASAEVEDVDGETLEPIGFDYRPFLEKGFLNWNHQANKTASAIIGEPTEARVISGGKKFWIKGFLYKGSPEAAAVYRLQLILEKSGSKRRLGFSIEGQATERDLMNPKRIKKARITGCAITASPKNPNTLMSLVKGEYDEPFVEEVEIETCPECDHDQLIEGKCLECGYEQKAMDTGNTGMLAVESIEGVKRTNTRDDDKVAHFLKKSEIYNRILTDYTQDVNIAKGIYNYILLANEKLSNMGGAKVTPEALEKALSFLDQSLVKSEEQSEVTASQEGQADAQAAASAEAAEGADAVQKGEENQEPGDEDDFDKACQMAKGFFDQGLNKGQVLDEMVKAGVSFATAEGACQRCINDANANKDGGTVTQQSHHVAAFDKSEMQAAFSELFATQNDLIKGINDNMDRKFGAVGTLMKGMMEENNDLRKAVGELTTRLATVETTSQGRKSVTTQTNAIERFQKSDDGTSPDNTFDIAKSEDRRQLINRMDAEAQRLRGIGRQNFTLEKGIANLEIAKGFGSDNEVQQIIPILQSMGIKILKSA